MMFVNVSTTADECSASAFLWLLIRSLTRQLAWKPSISRKINIHLAHAVCSNLYTFLGEGFGLTLRTAGSTAIVVSHEHVEKFLSSQDHIV